MKELLERIIRVRVLTDQGPDFADKSIREIIMSPNGIHADDVLNATRIFCAQIISDFDSEQAG